MKPATIVRCLGELQALASSAKDDARALADQAGAIQELPLARASHVIGTLEGRLDGLAEHIGKLAATIAADAERGASR